MNIAIDVDTLVVRRGGRVVLDGISCQMPAGTITGLVGPSGSGKTTLMRAIVGVQKVASGTVTVLGRPAGEPWLRQRVGYLTQAPSVYADLTLRENTRYFASLYDGVTRADADQAIADVGLSKAADHIVCRTQDAISQKTKTGKVGNRNGTGQADDASRCTGDGFDHSRSGGSNAFGDGGSNALRDGDAPRD